jgi:phenylalanyl-tRNA synthetase beta chain
MKISFAWLKQFIEFNQNITPKEVCTLLTNAGLEVENEIKERVFPQFVTAKILSTQKHPNADKLQVCNVFDGKQNLQIVCGAPNARSGITVVLAQVDAIIPNGNFQIKKNNIRDIESNGMLCSASELLMGIDSDGIIELPDEIQAGIDFTIIYKKYFQETTQIEIKLTPNRGDAASVIGIARDLAALGAGKLKQIEYKKPNCTTTNDIQIKIENCSANFCKITNIKNIQSPKWMQEFLLIADIKPKNAIIDITNYVMLSLGQPMQAYDANCVNENFTIGHRINQEFVDLKDNKNTLPEDMITIQNNNKDVAIAGIIGGNESKITDNSTNIILESAYFPPENISKTGQKLKINSDSRFRFERGVDYSNTLNAMYFAVDLITQICGGQVEWIKSKNITMEDKIIKYPLIKTKKILGFEIEKTKTIQILTSLGFKVNHNEGDIIKIHIPAYRNDIHNMQDITEELARIYGYDKIPLLPMQTKFVTANEQFEKIIQIKRLLSSNKTKEITSMSFINQSTAELFENINNQTKVINPISSDKNYMRNSLLPGLLTTISKNQSIENKSFAFFEEGLIFKSCKESEQNQSISAVFCGDKPQKMQHHKQNKYDIFDAKMQLFTILNEVFKFNLNKLVIKNLDCKYTHPFKSFSVYVGNILLANFGEIHPRVQKSFEIKEKIAFLELFLSNIPQKMFSNKHFTPFEQNDIQPIIREFAFIVDTKYTFANMIDAVLATKSEMIKNVKITDVYQGENLPQGKKSFAISVLIQPKNVISSAKIDEISNEIIKSVNEKINGVLRDGK